VVERKKVLRFFQKICRFGHFWRKGVNLNTSDFLMRIFFDELRFLRMLGARCVYSVVLRYGRWTLGEILFWVKKGVFHKVITQCWSAKKIFVEIIFARRYDFSIEKKETFPQIFRFFARHHTLWDPAQAKKSPAPPPPSEIAPGIYSVIRHIFRLKQFTLFLKSGVNAYFGPPLERLQIGHFAVWSGRQGKSWVQKIEKRGFSSDPNLAIIA